MTSRRLFGHIKSLLHFDFPYYNGSDKSLMASAGVHDDASHEHWNFVGNATLNGGPYRNYSIPSGAPKFGWRALVTYSASDYISCSNSYNTFTLKSQGTCELECFIQAVDSTAGNLISFLNGNNSVFTVSRDISGKIKLTASAWGLNAMGTAIIGTNSWHHIRVRITDNTAMLYVDGDLCLSTALTANITLTITECRIGGFNGFIDEFVYRDAADVTNSVPTSIYQGQLDILAMGGFGTGKHGALIVKAGQSRAINAYCQSILKCANGSSAITLGYTGWNNAALGTPGEGDEIMILVQARNENSPDELAGKYAFRYITSADGNNLTLDRPLDDDFLITEARQNYTLYVYHIPHFSSVTIEDGATLQGRFLGLCAFRCSGNVHISGVIAPANNTPHIKNDNVLLTPSDLPDRFIMSMGGGVMIFCGGTLTVSKSGIIGRTATNHANSAEYGRGGDGGGSSGTKGGIMRGGNASDGTKPNWKNHGPCILIVAPSISADSDSISSGGLHGVGNSSPGQYAGLCYFAGNFVG